MKDMCGAFPSGSAGSPTPSIHLFRFADLVEAVRRALVCGRAKRGRTCLDKGTSHTQTSNFGVQRLYKLFKDIDYIGNI